MTRFISKKTLVQDFKRQLERYRARVDDDDREEKCGRVGSGREEEERKEKESRKMGIYVCVEMTDRVRTGKQVRHFKK